MADPQAITCTLQRNTPVRDGAGGFTDSWADVSGAVGLAAKLRNRSPQPVSHDMGIDATQTRRLQFLLFDQPGPTLVDAFQEYRFVVTETDASTHTMLVQSVDSYEATMQIGVSRTQ